MAGDWQEVDRSARSTSCAVGPATVAQTTGGGHSATSLHYQGRARDFGSIGSDPGCLYAWFLPMARGSGYLLEELFYRDQGWKRGVFIGTIPGHYDHVHAGIRVGATLPLAAAPPAPPPPPKGMGNMFAVHLVAAPEVGWPNGALFVGRPGSWLGPLDLQGFAKAVNEGHAIVQCNAYQWDVWNHQDSLMHAGTINPHAPDTANLELGHATLAEAERIAAKVGA